MLWSNNSSWHARRQVQKPRQEQESLSFIYKIAHLHTLGTLTVTPFALHDVCTASLLCLPHPQRNSNSSECPTSRVTLATADAQDSPHRAHVHTRIHAQVLPRSGTQPSAINTPSRSGLSGSVRKDFWTAATQRGKTCISKHRWCLQTMPTFCPQRDKASVPN